MDWNECPESNGIGVRIAPEWVSGMPRNTLIDRNPNLRVEFENRILRQYYDWQYFLKRQ